MLVLVVLSIAAFAESVTLPHTFKTCNRKQANLTACLREAAEYNAHQLIHPFKDLRLPGLKPLVIPTLTIGSGKRAVAVEQHFKDCRLDGLDHVECKQFEFDFDRKLLVLDASFPEITKKCHYQLNGRVLLMPVQGEGDSTILLRDMRVTGNLSYEEVKRNGKSYLKFDAQNLSLDVSHVYFHFDNLFNGDKALGDGINRILNDNWKDVFEDVRSNYSKAVNAIIQSLMNNFWGRVSLEDALDI